jgi:hypothetical protein
MKLIVLSLTVGLLSTFGFSQYNLYQIPLTNSQAQEFKGNIKKVITTVSYHRNDSILTYTVQEFNSQGYETKNTDYLVQSDSIISNYLFEYEYDTSKRIKVFVSLDKKKNKKRLWTFNYKSASMTEIIPNEENSAIIHHWKGDNGESYYYLNGICKQAIESIYYDDELRPVQTARYLGGSLFLREFYYYKNTSARFPDRSMQIISYGAEDMNYIVSDHNIFGDVVKTTDEVFLSSLKFKSGDKLISNFEYEYDAQENWIKKKYFKLDELYQVWERQIVYYE